MCQVKARLAEIEENARRERPVTRRFERTGKGINRTIDNSHLDNAKVPKRQQERLPAISRRPSISCSSTHTTTMPSVEGTVPPRLLDNQPMKKRASMSLIPQLEKQTSSLRRSRIHRQKAPSLLQTPGPDESNDLTDLANFAAAVAFFSAGPPCTKREDNEIGRSSNVMTDPSRLPVSTLSTDHELHSWSSPSVSLPRV